MPTTYHLLPIRRYSSLLKGPPFQIGDRSKWTFELRVARVPVGSNVTVIVQTGATGEEYTYQQFITFGTVSTEGVVTQKTNANLVLDPLRNLWMRGYITGVTLGQVSDGNNWVSVGLDATAPFFDVKSTDHISICPKDLRESDDRERYLQQAEQDVVNFLTWDASTGILDIDLSIPESGEAIRREIARQATHLMVRESWAKQAPANKLALPLQMPPRAPLFCSSLRRFRPQRANAWYGR